MNRITLIGNVEKADYNNNIIRFKLMTKDIVTDAKTKKKIEKIAFHKVNCSRDIVNGVITKDSRVFVEGAFAGSEKNILNSEIEAHVVEVLGEKRSMN